MEDDLETERENLRLDIGIVRKMLDNARNQEPPDDILVQACTDVLRARCARLEQLGRSG